MLPIYDIVYGELTGVSLVERPAIESDFMLFNKQSQSMNFSFDEEKHIAFGPALIADKPIYRRGAHGEEFYVVFSKDVIEQMFTDFMKKKVSHFNLEHLFDTKDVFLLESFIKREGIQPVGYEDVADGSWFIAMKVEDEDIWNDVKSGLYNGFSVECTVDIEPKDELDDIVDELLK